MTQNILIIEQKLIGSVHILPIFCTLKHT